MVLTLPDADTHRALASCATAVVCEEDFLSPELEVMQSLLAAANNKAYVSIRARGRLREQEMLVESPQSLTQRENDILILLLKGEGAMAIISTWKTMMTTRLTAKDPFQLTHRNACS